MTYKVLKSLVYGGIAYAEGQEVDIIEKSIAENCIERELIAEMTDAEIDRTEVTENNEDATEEVVSSEENTETTENVEETSEELKKNNKRNRK